MILRKAEMKDMDLIYEWANDSLVRANSFNSEPIPYESHVNWYKSMMVREDVRQYILVKDGVDVGQIRLNIDKTGKEAEIGYSIAKDHRGQGLGKTMLELAKQKIKEEVPSVEILIAQVKPENEASKKAFLNSGFGEKCSVYEFRID